MKNTQNKCSHHLAAPLCDITDLLLASSTAPSEWKKAKVISLYESGSVDPTDFDSNNIIEMAGKSCINVRPQSSGRKIFVS